MLSRSYYNTIRALLQYYYNIITILSHPYQNTNAIVLQYVYNINPILENRGRVLPMLFKMQLNKTLFHSCWWGSRGLTRIFNSGRIISVRWKRQESSVASIHRGIEPSLDIPLEPPLEPPPPWFSQATMIQLWNGRLLCHMKAFKLLYIRLQLQYYYSIITVLSDHHQNTTTIVLQSLCNTSRV